MPLFDLLSGWCQRLGEIFTLEFMDPNTNVVRGRFISYRISFLSRKSKLGGLGQTNVALIFKGLMKSRLRIVSLLSTD